MAIRFKAQKSGLTEGYTFRVLHKETISTDEIVHFLVKESAISEADVRSTLLLLQDFVALSLSQGRRVNLERLGTFSISLKGTVEKLVKNFKLDSSQVSVQFLANSNLAKKMRANSQFEMDPRLGMVPLVVTAFSGVSKTENAYTSGRALRIKGRDLKLVDPASPDNSEGVFLTDSAGTEIRLGVEEMVDNTDRLLTFHVPSDLSGDLSLVIRTRYTENGRIRSSEPVSLSQE